MKPNTFAHLLGQYGNAPVVVRYDCQISGRQLLLQAEELASALSGDELASVFLATEDTANIIIALAACEEANVMLMLGPGSLDNAQIRQITSELGIAGMLGISDEKLVAAPSGHSNPNRDRFEVALMTSGTSGNRKIARHDPANLMGRIRPSDARTRAWLLTYTPTGFAGMQVILTALATCSRLVCPSDRQLATMIPFAAENGVTHASGTPTFWRAWLLASAGISNAPKLEQITIGGEAVDQNTLDRLAAAYPSARITHIYASTEAGSVFSVNDKKEGFPASWLSTGIGGVGLRMRDGILEIRTPRRMSRYMSHHDLPVIDGGWLRTGDLVRIENDRILFAGRQDKIINVAGFKVFPEDIERTLLNVSGVADAYVYSKPNVITGNVLLADITVESACDPAAVVAAAKAYVRGKLPRHQLPAIIRVVPQLQTAESGKKQR